MSSYTLVVHWKLPDDATTTAEDAILDLAKKIHTLVPADVEQAAAYTGVCADIIAQAAEVGAVVEQADRLAVKPGDVVTVRLGASAEDYTNDEFAQYCTALETAFPDNKIVVLENGATITAGPAAEGGTS